MIHIGPAKILLPLIAVLNPLDGTPGRGMPGEDPEPGADPLSVNHGRVLSSVEFPAVAEGLLMMVIGPHREAYKRLTGALEAFRVTA